MMLVTQTSRNRRRTVVNIKPYDKTIKELLGSGKQFSIPRFQRAYSWEKRNYKEFFEDMLNNLHISGGRITPDQYFMGTMLFVGDYPEGPKPKVDVVDGQQRLTTITILFSAISDRFLSVGEKVLSDQIFKYIMTADDNGDSVRILESKTHYPFFSYFIQTHEKGTRVPNADSEEEEVIKNTYDYMYSVLDEGSLRKALKKNYGSDDVDKINYIDILKAIRDQVLGTTFISISTTENSQANMIFEILNAKGKRLSNVDLIKNKIFEIVDDVEPADFAYEEWKKLNETLTSRENGIALTTFYRHFWISKYKKSSESKLYEDFVATIKPKTKPQYEQFLKDLVNEAKHYIQIINPERSDYKSRKEYYGIVQSLNALSNYFNIAQVRVAILALYDMKEKGLIKLAELKDCIYYFENFHFAYNTIASLPTNRLEGIYSTFAISLRKCNNQADIKTQINKIKEELSKIFPTYQDFENGFTALSFSKKENSSNVKTKYALNKINAYYQQTDIFSEDGSIEHIAPESEGQENLNIGNLIVLESSLNQEAGNLPYEDKLDIYEKSEYKQVKAFIGDKQIWNRSMIADRAKALAKIYYEDILGRGII